MSKETKSNDLLDEAYDTISKIRAKKLARQALEIWPDNIDAEGFIADFEENQIKKLSLYEKIVKKATMLLESEELFDEENIGHFWGIIETRPYMRARAKKITILEDLGRYTEAIREYEEMLRLCRSDNLGLRYKLMALYCMLEKFDECEKLYKQYNEESAYMLFLMAFVYFKKGNYRKSKKYIMKLNICNEYVYRILNNDSIIKKDVEYYAQGSIEEASMIIEDLFCLIGSTPSIIAFMQITLNQMSFINIQGYIRCFQSADIACGMLLGAISKRFDTIVEFSAFEDFISFEKNGKNRVKRTENHRIKVTIEVDMVCGAV